MKRPDEQKRKHKQQFRHSSFQHGFLPLQTTMTVSRPPMGKEDAASYLEKLTQRSNEIKTNFDVEKVYGE